MVLVRAVILYDFDSTEYGAEYLAVSVGAHVIVNTATEDQGWVVAAVSNGGYPLCGWIPSEFWSCMEVLNVSNGANVAVNIAAEDERPVVVAVRDGGQPLRGLTEILQRELSVIPYLTFCDWNMLLDLAMVNKNAWRYSTQKYREHTDAVCDEKFPIVCKRFPSFKSDVLRYGLPDLRRALVWSNGEYWLYPVWRRVRVERWWYFCSDSRFDIGWELHTVHYLHHLHVLNALWEKRYHTCGLYMHQQIILSWWTWGYDRCVWEEEDCV